MEVEGRQGSFQEIEAQALAVAVFKDEKADDGFLKDLDAASGGIVKSVIDSEEFKGKEGETIYLHLKADTPKPQRLLLIGTGEQKDYTASHVSQFAGTAARFLRDKNVKSVALIPRLDGDAESVAANAVDGAI